MNAITNFISISAKKFKFLGIVIICKLIILTGCIQNNTLQKQVISVSILPQKYFTEKIVGDRYNINVLIPPGASPATYDPTPHQIVDLSNSKLYFKIGYIEFEKSWINKFSAENNQLIVFDNSQGVELLGVEHDQHGGIEPHIWMSPSNVKVIARNILEAVISIDKQNEDFYLKNFNEFMVEIDSIERIIANDFKDLKSRSFIIYHPALTYFAHDYGLKQISIEFEGKTPSPAYIKEIIDKAKKEDVKLVFVQKQFDKSKAETIAREINGFVVYIDPLAYNWPNQILFISREINHAFKNEKE